MEGLICDSSTWINFLNGINTPQEILLARAIVENRPIFTCPVILQEVLQGIREDKEYEKVKTQIMKFEIISDLWTEASIGSAEIYRSLRKKGVTIRKPNDCLIAWYAIHHDLTLVHNDVDFDLIAQHTPLKTYQPA